MTRPTRTLSGGLEEGVCKMGGAWHEHAGVRCRVFRMRCCWVFLRRYAPAYPFLVNHCIVVVLANVPS